ncbi:ABC transporter ATP-binding protein [Herbaspirillum sp. YR522]|uniref:ABC transporter ATP-binding protein n=1 Tax=Herbaspirillum sp. YR522 TaxID=1144342 RepID=UPI00026FBC64|nr:ABC transporter ATP-binding protein [Herbaspirillum sp. YR522]EJN02712.1 ABC-type spermidine/putrescine transport system, ATPase component [Herbaspirillum sp. YR522]
MTEPLHAPTGVGLVIDQVRKHYGAFTALDDISLSVPPGALLTLLGPSGCGKSTLLRIIAGFASATSGQVQIGGSNVANVPPFQRETAMVFQSYALFPHMRIVENVMFGLKMRKVKQAAARERAMQALEMVRLAHLADRYPAQLSGGQQQRAALARALVTDPKILLLDEPFGALDKSLREEMQVELRKLQKSVGVTTVCVTHDQAEAMTISDYVAVMKDGKLEQFGRPLDIYDRPRSEFVATFIGSANVFKGTVQSVAEGRIDIGLPGAGTVNLAGARSAGQAAAVAVRPGAMAIDVAGGAANGAATGALHMPGQVAFCVNLGHGVSYEVSVPGLGKVMVERPRRQDDVLFEAGQQVELSAAACDCVLLEA